MSHYKALLTVLSREKRLALKHFGKDASRAPDIDGDVVLLPCEHDLRRSIVPRRDITGHLRILNARKTKIADLKDRVRRSSMTSSLPRWSGNETDL